MALFGALEGALSQLRGASVQDGSGQVYSGEQLLQLARAVAELLEQTANVDHPERSSSQPGGFPPACGIYLSNSAAYVVAVLAALQLGLPFMPLDPAWPAHRLQQLCGESQPAAVIWSAAGSEGGHGAPPVTVFPLLGMPLLPQLLQQLEQQAQLSAAAGEQAAQAAGEGRQDAAAVAGVPWQVQEQAQKQGPPSPPKQQGQQGQQERCCYLLFTSGSIGRPLGVLGTEQGVLNRCRWLEAAYPFQAGDRVAFKTSPAFVDSVWEVFGPLLAGVPLVAVPSTVGRDSTQLLRFLAEQRITHLAAVPTLWRGLAASMRQLGSVAAALQLRVAVSSGEPLPPQLLTELQQLLPPGCSILNLYGSTEVAADCTAFDCSHLKPPAIVVSEREHQQEQFGRQQQQAEHVPVGKPVSGTVIAVLGPDPIRGDPAADAITATGSLRPVLPLGSVGEVAVGGAGLAAGYLPCHPAAAAAQQQRFVRLPTQLLQDAQRAGAAVAAAADLAPGFWQEENMRLFITGDLGWLAEGGCLHLAGRRDLQVKLAGTRVDLAEVEAVLSQHPAVEAAAARLWQLPAGPVLAACVQLAGSDSQPAGTVSESMLQQWCRDRLLPAAVPQQVLFLDQLPRSAAGKVQRSQLPPPPGLGPEAVAASPAEGSTHQANEGHAAQPSSKRQRSEAVPAVSAAGAAAAAPAAAAAATTDRQPGTVSASPAPAAVVSELAVSRAFAAALGHADFEATTNLFAIGGNSLMAAQIAGEVAGGDVEAVFRHPTVRSLAAFLNAGALAAAAAALAAHSTGAVGASAAAGSGQVAAAAGGAVPLLAARQLVVSGNAGMQKEQQPAGFLQLIWRARMLQCVDASPLFQPVWADADAQQHAEQHPVQQRPAQSEPPGEQLPPQQQPMAGQAFQLQSTRVFACSHGGDVCCYDSSNGQQLWCTMLPDRTDAGLTLCMSPQDGSQHGSRQQAVPAGRQQYVAAATNGGVLFFLDSRTGSIAGSTECGGGIRAPPACDPWHGLVWQPSHGRQLVVAAAPGREVARMPCPAAVSAAVTFHTALQLAFVCCLDGSVLAVAAKPPEGVLFQQSPDTCISNSSDSGGSTGGSIARALQLNPVWQRQLCAPLFTPAAVLHDCVVAAAVDGSVAALASRDGQQLWRTTVGSDVYCPILLLPAVQQTPAAVLVGTQAGRIVALDGESGRQLVAAAELGSKVTGMQLLELPTAAPPELAGTAAEERLVLVTLAPGTVVLVQLSHLLEDSSPGDTVLDAVQLPANVFAPPAVCSNSCSSGAVRACMAVVGCRDDHLYCLQLPYSLGNS